MRSRRSQPGKHPITPLASAEDSVSRPSKRAASSSTARATKSQQTSKRPRVSTSPRFNTQPTRTSKQRPTPPPPQPRPTNLTASQTTRAQAKHRPPARRLRSNASPDPETQELDPRRPDPLFTVMDLDLFNQTNSSEKGFDDNGDEDGNFSENEDKGSDNSFVNNEDEDFDNGLVSNEDNRNGFVSKEDDDNGFVSNEDDEPNGKPNQQSVPGAITVNRSTANRPTTVLGSLANTSSSHMTGGLLQSFNRFAQRASLDEGHKTIGRKLCNATDSQDQFVSSMVTILSARQEIVLARNDILKTAEDLKNLIPKTNTTVWKGGTELKQCVKQIAYQCILSGDVQAYTAQEDKEGDQEELPHSLFAKVMSEILSSPSEWKDRVLPPGYGKDPEPGAVTALRSLINNALKEIRKSFEKILITGINLPSRVATRSSSKVPTLETIILKLKRKEKGLIGGRFRFREEIVQDVTELQKTRYAWLRMHAAHWGMNRAKYDHKHFWTVVDNHLEFLRTKSTRYRYAFFLTVLRYDVERFNGEKSFEQLKDKTSFSLPTEARIKLTMDELDETFGDEVGENEVEFEALEA